MNKNKVLLIGWDAADWKLIGPLMAKGQMPALKRLIDKGVYGNMGTMKPPFSPMLWTTVATGKTPDKHGVHGFIEVQPDRKGIRPVTVNSRKTRAIWNILHNQGYKSNLVGWWPSFPAEPINGVVVSDKFQKVKKDPRESNPILKGTIYPENKTKDLADLRMFPYEITEAHILPFIPQAARINQEEDKRLNAFAKIVSENVSVHAAATNLMRTTEWDFMAVYYDLIDHFCHAYMKYHPPKMQGIPKEMFEIYKDCVEGAYRFQDMMLERMMDLAGEDTTIIVMSDHGYESDHRRILKMPKYPAAPALEHRQFGIFVAAGPNIKQNEKVHGLGLIDVAPTILQLYGLPIAKDMDGKPALDIFKTPLKPNYIESWDEVEGDFGEHEAGTEYDVFNEQETMQQLVDLGYIENPDEKVENAVLKTSCDLKHNLARVYLGKKEYNAAKEILLQLVNDEYPIFTEDDFKGKRGENLKKQQLKVGDSIVDKIPFYLDLLSIALSEKDFDTASDHLTTLKNLDKRKEINTSIAEAKIFFGKGKTVKALKHLEAVKNKRPNSMLWFEIGKIHRQLNQLNEAKLAFEKALSFEIDKARYHQALAETLIRLGDYEAAADHALTSIELIKYFPEAHYTLGEALEKMGNLENAKMAYEMASKLRPTSSIREENALENIQDKIKQVDKAEFKHKENQIVVVSGLPRSGTSMMMQMLNAGGLEPLTDDLREADISNPKGYFEYEPVKTLHKDNSWLYLAQNKVVKVVAPLLKFLSPRYRYKIIFMTRDLSEVIKSQRKMIGKNEDILPLKLMESFTKQLNQVEIWKDKAPFVELIYMDYNEVLNNPTEVVYELSRFIGKDLNLEAMKSCVDVSLYRTKV